MISDYDAIYDLLTALSSNITEQINSTVLKSLEGATIAGAAVNTTYLQTTALKELETGKVYLLVFMSLLL